MKTYISDDASRISIPVLKILMQFMLIIRSISEKDYERLLNTEKNKSIELWAWKNDKAAAEFAVLCAKDIKNVTLTASDLSGNAGVISSSKVQLAFIKDVKGIHRSCRLVCK